MNTTSRLLLATIAAAAAVSGGAASAYADSIGPSAGPSSDDSASSGLNLDSVLCPIASGGLIGATVNGLNPQSLPGACGGLSSGQAK